MSRKWRYEILDSGHPSSSNRLPFQKITRVCIGRALDGQANSKQTAAMTSFRPDSGDFLKKLSSAWPAAMSASDNFEWANDRRSQSPQIRQRAVGQYAATLPQPVDVHR